MKRCIATILFALIMMPSLVMAEPTDADILDLGAAAAIYIWVSPEQIGSEYPPLLRILDEGTRSGGALGAILSLYPYDEGGPDPMGEPVLADEVR